MTRSTIRHFKVKSFENEFFCFSLKKENSKTFAEIYSVYIPICSFFTLCAHQEKEVAATWNSKCTRNKKKYKQNLQ